MTSRPCFVTVACEGHVDNAVIGRVLEGHDVEAPTAHVTGGVVSLMRRLPGFIAAAHHSAWIVQRDLDQDAACAPELLRDRALAGPPGLNLIIAVRQTESWLLADRDRIAAFLGVRAGLVAEHPEMLASARDHVVSLARRSRQRAIRDGMVPRESSGRAVGAEYAGRMIEFASRHWQFDDAAQRAAPSLRTFVRRVQCFARTGQWRRAD